MGGRYSAADYAAAVRRLMPRGRVWSSDPDSVQGRVIGGLMQVGGRIDSDAIALIADVFPSTTTNMLPEWEATLGLPDPCLGPNPTLQQRRDQITARFAGVGGQTVQRFKDYAALLGFEIDVTEMAPFRMGRSRMGQPLGEPGVIFGWLVTILSDATSTDHAAFRVGQNHMGDPLNSSAASHAMLECELRAIAPSHTVLLFSF